MASTFMTLILRCALLAGTANLYFGEADATWFPYTVLEQGPEDLTVVAGETARFSCDLNLAARHDAIWWLFESSGCFLYISRNELLRRTCGINMHHYRIDVDTIHRIYTIEIDNVSEKDAGTYICKNESSILASAKLTVLPRSPDPTAVTAVSGECADGVCCEVSYYPTGLEPSSELEAQAMCRWPAKYNNIDIHVHLFCDGLEIRGSNKVLLADRAVGRLPRFDQSGCANFSCTLEIVGESDVKDSCSIHKRNINEVAVKVEPEISFVEEGMDAIFFCHINNAPPTSGSFRWYLVHTQHMSVNYISSQPIASTSGYYGKLELSSVKLDDDFMTIQCHFEPDNSGNYSTKSNPAVLRVLRRSRTQIYCYTGSRSSLLECTEQPPDKDEKNTTDDSFKMWPLTVKEWFLFGTILFLLLVIVIIRCPNMHKHSRQRRALEDRSRHYYERDLNVTDTVNQPDPRYPRGRYEYLAERYYDAPYSLLRNIRNFPRRLRHRVLQRHYARSARQARQCEADQSGSPNLTYGSIDPRTGQAVSLRERMVSRPSETTELPEDTSSRHSSDYDILDASTINVFPPSSSSSPRDELSSSSASSPGEVSSSAKKPRVAPKPTSQSPPTRIPSISAEIDNQENSPESHTNEPHYVNVNDEYALPGSSANDGRSQTRVASDGYLEPIQEKADYQTIC